MLISRLNYEGIVEHRNGNYTFSNITDDKTTNTSLCIILINVMKKLDRQLKQKKTSMRQLSSALNVFNSNYLPENVLTEKKIRNKH